MAKQRQWLVAEAEFLKEAGIFLKVHQNAKPFYIPHLNAYSSYSTVAVLTNSDGEELATGIALCGPYDQPKRKLGWNIAVGRCLANYRRKVCAGELPDAIVEGWFLTV
jgi:hypothetical protein